jgi:hypothetical protein
MGIWGKRAGSLGSVAAGGLACGDCAMAAGCGANCAASTKAAAVQIPDLHRKEKFMTAKHLVRRASYSSLSGSEHRKQRSVPSL